MDEAVIKIKSNAAITTSELISNASPANEISVRVIAGKKIGSVIGKSKIWNNPPLTVAEVVNAAVNVPAAASPISPIKIVVASKKIFSICAANRIKNVGRIKIVSAVSDKKT